MDRESYFRAAYWDLREAAILLLSGTPINDDGFISSDGMRPLRSGEPDPVQEICELARRAIDTGELACVGKKKHRRVSPHAFAAWAIENGYRVPDDWHERLNPISAPLTSPPAEDWQERLAPTSAPLLSPPAGDNWRDDQNLLKSQKQARAISEAINTKGFNPLSVPDGEKGTIEALCKLEYPELFTADTAFTTVWKFGVRNGLWKMQSHASYAKRGKE